MCVSRSVIISFSSKRLAVAGYGLYPVGYGFVGVSWGSESDYVARTQILGLNAFGQNKAAGWNSRLHRPADNDIETGQAFGGQQGRDGHDCYGQQGDKD